MAITSIVGLAGNSAANVHVPAYNQMIVSAGSNATAQPNFEYIFDIYIDGITFGGGSSYVRMKIPADPTYGTGFCDLSPIVQRYVSADLGDTIYGFQQCSNSIKKITVQFGELYGASSEIVAYPNQNSYICYGFNASFGVFEWKDFESIDYTADTSLTEISFLTNAPSSGTIDVDTNLNNAWIYLMSGTSGAIKYANINTYTGTGSSKVLYTTSRVINHAYHNTSTIANRMLRFPSGLNLNGIVESSISGTYPIIDAAVTAWEIYFTDSSRNRITESYWFIRNTPCSSHDEYRLHFLNKSGGFDSFSFIRAHQITTGIKRNKFEKVMATPESATRSWYLKTDRFEKSFYTEYKHTIRLNSDWITETQSIWLEELLTSPDVRMDDLTHGIVPINIVNTEYVQRQHKTDKKFNIVIDIQYTFNEIRQGA